MRIGIRLVGAVAGLAVVALVATMALGAGAGEEVKHVPLGGSLTGQVGERYFGVYVPTRFGGTLTVKASSGTVEEIVGPDGRERKNGQEIGNDQQGWYRFKVASPEQDAPYTVETSFVQVGLSNRIPWNFYYWPTKADAIHEPWAGGNARVDTMQPHGDDVMVATPGGYIAPGQDIVRAGPNGLLETPAAAGDTITWFPNLYDDLTFRGADGTIYATPSPMLKYDQLFNSSARNWEAANSQNQDIQRWPGHCLGGAVASIMLNEPIPAPGSGFTQDELKSLWAELGREPLQPPDRRLRQRDPPRPSPPGPRLHRQPRPPVPQHARDPHPGQPAEPARQPPGLPAPRDRQRGLEPRGRQVRRDLPRRPRQGRALGPAGGRGLRQLRLEPQQRRPQAADQQVRVHHRLRARRQGRRHQPLHRRLDLRRAARRSTAR